MTDPSSASVLVTGGAKRLGREFCLAFARAGWNVACHYRDSAAEALALADEVRSLGARCVTLQADLAHPDSAANLMDAACAAAGEAPRCVVNNASAFIADDGSSATHQQLTELFALNTATPLLLGRELALRLRGHAQPVWPTGSHSVLHVLDQKVHNLNPDYFSYTVSKLALERAVALQAQALAPTLRVCGLSPGLMYPSGPQSLDNFERASRVNLLAEPIDPREVARAAVFLATSNAITGVTLSVDNGQHLVPLSRDVMFAIDAAPAKP